MTTDRQTELTKHGLRDIRELEFCKYTMIVYDKLKPLVEIDTIQSPLIKSYVEKAFREDGLIISFITLGEVTERVGGLLQITGAIRKLKTKLKKAKEEDKENIERLLKVYLDSEKEMIQYEYELLKLSRQYDDMREIKIKEAN